MGCPSRASCILAVFSLTFCLALLPLVANASENFTSCGNDFKDGLRIGNPVAVQYVYRQRPKGLLPGHDPPPLLTFAGCKHYCGATTKYYPWTTISDTITTWILPLIGGLVLQAPFESNDRLATLLVLCRWLGSPIASLTCTFWNIRVTEKCALILDMAVHRDTLPGYHSRSFIAMLGDACTRVKNGFRGRARSRIFNSWPLPRSIERAEEREIATAFAELRDSLYILSVLNQFGFDHSQPEAVKSLVRFALFSRGDFGIVVKRSKLATAIRRERKHGVVQVLVSLLWFVMALVISIYKAFGELGSNSTAHNLAIGLCMSWLPVIIASSLTDRNPTNAGHTNHRLQKFLSFANRQLPQPHQNMEKLLTDYCGQGRKKWHYGIAHSLLTEFNLSLRSRERGVLSVYQDGTMATFTQMRGQVFWTVDIVELWQTCLAFGVVACAEMGAFLVSYNTPTVGLGCRSGGYMILGVLAAVAFGFEAIGWILYKPDGRDAGTKRRRSLYVLRRMLSVFEVVNTGWLIYILLAQTFGIYNSCACKSSLWGAIGGYMDFEDNLVYRTDYNIRPYWIGGTAVGMLPFTAILYIVYQWCTQSFLWAEDYEKAMRGLKRVRRLKYMLHLDVFHAVLIAGPDRIKSYILKANYRGLTWRR